MTAGRILLVDDNPDILDTAKDILDDQGYDVQAASGIEAALAEQQKNPFDLMIVDFNMPDGNGLALAATVHQNHPQTRVILMSGDAALNLATVPAGAVYDFLIKPVDLQKLLQVIEKALQSRQ